MANIDPGEAATNERSRPATSGNNVSELLPRFVIHHLTVVCDSFGLACITTRDSFCCQVTKVGCSNIWVLEIYTRPMKDIGDAPTLCYAALSIG